MMDKVVVAAALEPLSPEARILVWNEIMKLEVRIAQLESEYEILQCKLKVPKEK